MESELQKLQKNFNAIVPCVRERLAELYGPDLANKIEKNASLELERIKSQVPFVTEGFRAFIFNSFMRITVLELVLYQAMKKEGFSPAQVWEVCHYVLRKTIHPVPKWKRWLSGKLIGSFFAEKRMQQRENKGEIYKVGNFKISFLGPVEGKFNFGVNYQVCSMHQFLLAQDAAEFAPFVCMSDIVLSEEYNWGLKRTKTLADGADHCDFRFCSNCPTKITSITPKVQETIEKIAKAEKERIIKA